MSKYIYILPIDLKEDEILEFLKFKIMEKFELECKILNTLRNPDYAFDSQRKQYFSTRILKEISRLAPDDARKIIGIVNVDLYIPILTFVFGEAQLNGKAAILSLFRLRQEYYGLNPNKDLLRIRALKEAIHELGHTFGLTHCSNYKCVMYFSNNVRNIDMKKEDFCDGCSDLLAAFSRE